MNVYLVNDCFKWYGTVMHYGCKAIIDSLKNRITKAGHKIVAIEARPKGPEIAGIEKCDMVIINGEGTFRDEDKNFEHGRHDRMFTGIKLAKEKGKNVYLINTVWHRMSDRWKEVLQSLDGISVREPASAEAIYKLSGVTPEIHPDEAFFLDVEVPMCERVEVFFAGDFYENVQGLRNDAPFLNQWGRLGLLSDTWDHVVSILSESALYITGQHHGVYAAIKARCPFVAGKVNTPKLTSLFEWAGVNIPLANTIDEVKDQIETYMDRMGEFERLFDFVQRQQPWPIPT